MTIELYFIMTVLADAPELLSAESSDRYSMGCTNDKHFVLEQKSCTPLHLHSYVLFLIFELS